MVQTTRIYFSQLRKLEIWDQGVGRFGFSWGLSLWLADGSLFAVCSYGCLLGFVCLVWRIWANCIFKEEGGMEEDQSALWALLSARKHFIDALSVQKLGWQGTVEFVMLYSIWYTVLCCTLQSQGNFVHFLHLLALFALASYLTHKALVLLSFKRWTIIVCTSESCWEDYKRQYTSSA